MSPAETTRAIILFGYIVVAVTAVVTELLARRRPDGLAPLGDMLDAVMESRTTRVAVIAAWWWFGWHFLFAPTVQLEL